MRVRVRVCVRALVMASVLPLGLPLVTLSTACHQGSVDDIFVTIVFFFIKSKVLLCTTDYKEVMLSSVLIILSSTRK